MDLHIPRSVADKRSTGIVVCLLVLAITAINLQLSAFDYPALADWPNHLARHAIQCGLEEGSFGRFYQIEFRLIPNLASDLLHFLPIACESLDLTQRVLYQFSVVGFVVATIVLHYSIWRQWSVWPVVSAVFAHHLSISMGFENFIIAAPVGILAIALWIFFVGARSWLRVAIFVPVSFLLYAFHLYVFFAFAVTLVCIEIQRDVLARTETGGRRWAAVGGLVPVFLVLIGPTVHFLVIVQGSETPSLGNTAFGAVVARAEVLASTLLVAPGINRESDTAILFFISLLSLILMAVVLKRFGPSLEVDRRFLFPILVLLAVSLLLPVKIAGNAAAHIRVPVVLFALVIGAVNWRPNVRALLVFAIVVLGVFAFRVEIIGLRWAPHDREVRELLAATAVLGPQDRLIVGEVEETFRARRHGHSAVIAARETGAFIPTLFTRTNILMPRSGYEDRTTEQSPPVPLDYLIEDARRGGSWAEIGLEPAYWMGWRDYYTHLLLLHGEDVPDADLLAGYADLLVRGSFFDLYATIPSD